MSTMPTLELLVTPEKGTNPEIAKNDAELASKLASGHVFCKISCSNHLQHRPQKLLIASLRYGLVLAGIRVSSSGCIAPTCMFFDWNSLMLMCAAADALSREFFFCLVVVRISCPLSR